MPQKIKFKPTKAQESLVAEHSANGQEFELLSKFVAEKDGMWCLKAIENEPMAGYEEADQKPASDMKGGAVGQSYRESMKGSGGY